VPEEPKNESVLHVIADSLIELYDGKPFDMTIHIDFEKKLIKLKECRCTI
jgi:hypothetical protein